MLMELRYQGCKEKERNGFKFDSRFKEINGEIIYMALSHSSSQSLEMYLGYLCEVTHT